MEAEDFSVNRFTEKSSSLAARMNMLFAGMNRQSDELPENAFTQDNPLKVVFAGQYSAGKSTIIKALTGLDEITIGPTVTTEVVTSYPWHGMLLIDTPGIGTGQRAYKHHDALSLKAISESDVLVYVITSEGFEPGIAEEFKKLIIDKDKAGETILVINKMTQCQDGNTPQQRAIIAEDLARTTFPYTPEDLHAVYIDAESYLMSKKCEDDDPSFVMTLRDEANMNDLRRTLDALSCGNDVAARLTTPLYRMMEEIDNSLDDLGSTEGEQTRLLREKLKEERNKISSIRSRILSSSLGHYTVAASDIREEGRRLADTINECKSDADAAGAIDTATQRVLEIESECLERIDSLLQEAADALDAAYESLYESLQKGLSVNLAYDNNQYDLIRSVLGRLVSQGVLTKGKEKIAALTIGDAAENGLKAYRASKAHLFFRKASQKLGIKLKPWGAVKMAKGLNYLGKAMGAAGVILPALLELKDERDVAIREEVAQTNRESIRSQFNDEARAFIQKCRNGVSEFEEELIQPRLDAINQDLATFLSDELRRSKDHTELLKLRNDCSEIVREIRRWQRTGAC